MVAVGDKFIIEIAEAFKGAESGKLKYRIKGFDNLNFDDNGLKRLTNFKDVYNTAYQEGYEMGYKMGENSINGMIPANADDRFIEGFQTAAVKYTKIIHDITDAFNKLDELKEDN